MVKLPFTVFAAACLSALSLSLPAQTLPGSSPSVAKRPAPKASTPVKPETPAAAPKPIETHASKSGKPIDPSQPFPLLAVHVEGARRLNPAQITALSGLKIGSPVNQDSFAEAHLALMNTGLFESVAYKFEKPANRKGYIATFEVEETNLFYPIRLEDIPADHDAVLAYLKKTDPAFDGQSAATEPALQRYSRLIGDYLASIGKPMKVRGRVWAEQGGDLSVMYRPDTDIPSISDVRFEGSERIEPLELRRILIQTATGLLFTEDRFRALLNNEIVPAYWAVGRLGVRFPKIEATPLSEEKGVRVLVTVDEGPEFMLKQIHIESHAIPEETLLKAVKFPVGETALMTKVAGGVREILDRYKMQGYINADARFEPELNFDDRTADVTIVVTEGPQYRFHELKITGLDLVNEAGIRKLWSLERGQPFNSLYPDFFLEQIHERQLMESLGSSKAQVDLDEKDRTATVTLSFQAPDKNPPPRVPLVRPQ